jgi:hypothetical protein
VWAGVGAEGTLLSLTPAALLPCGLLLTVLSLSFSFSVVPTHSSGHWLINWLS